MKMDKDTSSGGNGYAAPHLSASAAMERDDAASSAFRFVEDGAAGGGDAKNTERKRRTEVEDPAASLGDGGGEPSSTTTRLDNDAGSSLLFQPHRSLGLLTAATSSKYKKYSPSYLSSSSQRLMFQSQKGKFHLQAHAQSSDEAFVSVPLGERFQIITVSKLVPVLVSRALPPSAAHHRHSPCGGRHGRSNKGGGGGSGEHEEGEDQDEEDMHRAFSDSSLDVTVATHGPAMLGRAVSITLYSRTRPLVCLDAFPFLANNAGRSKKRKGEEKSTDYGWGIVDVIPLGKQRVAMSGEKEGRMENALLFAMVCTRGDFARDENGSGGEEGGGVEGRGGAMQVVGEDSEEESESSGSSSGNESEPTATISASTSSDESIEDGDSDNDYDSTASLESMDKSPRKDCYGRVLIVQATRANLEILKTVDLDGSIGSNFVPYVGLHPATYVNKILLGGRPATPAIAGLEDGDMGNGTSMLLLNVRSGKMIHSFHCLPKLGKQKQGIAITALEQSPAVDTVAVGTSDGCVHLVNTLHDVRLFMLQHKSKHHPNKMISSGNVVTSISFRTDGNATRQGVAPLAVGCDDGSISVWDLTPIEDENNRGEARRTLLSKMESVHHGGISKVEYLPGEPLLLSTGLSSNSIFLHVFDAPDHSGRVLRSRRGHTSPPRLLRYLHPGIGGGGGGSSSVLASVADGTDASSCQILSCGGPGDLSLRLFSTARSNLDKEYSQGQGLERKAKKLFGEGDYRSELLLPEIIGLATSDARGRDWGDLVTIHRDHAMAYVWSTRRGAQSGPVLRQPQWNVSAMKERPPRSAHATSLAVSSCGNFALVGTAGGVVYKYNLQSGLPRGSFPRDASSTTSDEERRRRKGLKFAGDIGRTVRVLEKKAGKGGAMASDVDKAEQDRRSFLDAEARRKAIVERASHSGSVVGIAVDSLNRTVVTAGMDSKLVLWNFSTHMPHKKSPIELPSPATRLAHVRDSDLAAIAMRDYGVAVFDCASLAIVRYFGGSQHKKRPIKEAGSSHYGPISDLSFGPDGRKLFTSSLDGTIRVWDIPTGLCVDWMSFSSPPTSLTLSPTGEFLATSHVGQLGISLWCDKSFFRMVLLNGAPKEPAKMNEPCPVAECEQEGSNDTIAYHAALSVPAKKDDASFGDGESKVSGVGLPPQPKKQGLITLSGLPPAHWKNLFHLELVKERNKPIEAPQKPPQAPFFLQWRSGLESGAAEAGDQTTHIAPGPSTNDATTSKDATNGWDAVWSDDEAEDGNDGVSEFEPGQKSQVKPASVSHKRRKVVHYRSKLAELLQTCGETYSNATSYLSKLGPSSIDVEISSLCYGIHDLEEGLPLLHHASKWLLEACESCQSFEAVNAYLHRFLYVHGNIITRIDQALQEDTESLSGRQGEDAESLNLKEFTKTISLLKEKQRDASNGLQGKMQHALCLLRHLSRMV